MTKATTTKAPTAQSATLPGLDLGPVPPEIEDEAREASARVAARRDPREALAIPRGHPGALMSKDVLKRRADALEYMQDIAIRSTGPLDWTLYKDRDGRVVAVLRDSGAVKVRKWLGIRIFGHRNQPDVRAEGVVPEPRITDEMIDVEDRDGKVTGKQRIWIAEMWADGGCEVTGEIVESVGVGLRSHDKYGRQDFVGRGHRQDLAASARTSLDTKIVRILSGLRKVDADILVKAGIDLERAYKGSGYGTSQDRTASGVSEAGLEERKIALRDEILRRAGGDEATARDILRDITKWTGKDGKERWSKSVEQLTKAFQVEKAMEALKAHPTFGDAAGGREPGSEG